MLPVLHGGPAPWTWVSGVQAPNYNSGLALQAVGVRIRRSRSVALDGTLGVATPLFTGSIARAADGTDLSLPPTSRCQPPSTSP